MQLSVISQFLRLIVFSLHTDCDKRVKQALRKLDQLKLRETEVYLACAIA